MEQLTKNQAVATSQEAVQNQNEPQLRDEMLTMTNLSTECLIQLTKLGYDATPFNQILKQNAKREMRLRLGKVTVADVLAARSEERFSRNAETDLVCRLLLEKKKNLVARVVLCGASSM